ncbi:MAG TPA: metallophosphoesterase [Acidobacteriaceae bacterium]|nr:metallophosphoesterase [Acidobacteriaceae bacterium]
MRPILIAFSLLALWLPYRARAEQGSFFAVVADPQFGMYSKDQNFAHETANFEYVIANLNRLHPRFVVICGDLVNRTGDAGEIAEYKRIVEQLDPSIPVYNVAGNHDLGNVPTATTLAAYRKAFGPDYYTFSQGDILGIVLDSSLIASPQGDAQAAREQEQWLRETLAAARSHPKQRIVIFQHIPYFTRDPGEAAGYFNIPEPNRQIYLNLLQQAGVQWVFAGHYHRNAGGADGSLQEIVTGAAGMPLGGSRSGFRIVMDDGQQLSPEWYCLGGIPDEVEIGKQTPTPCSQ